MLSSRATRRESHIDQFKPMQKIWLRLDECTSRRRVSHLQILHVPPVFFVFIVLTAGNLVPIKIPPHLTGTFVLIWVCPHLAGNFVPIKISPYFTGIFVLVWVCLNLTGNFVLIWLDLCVAR